MTTIDLRMLNSSGIGTYLQNLIPGIIGASSNFACTFLGETSKIRKLPWTHGKNLVLIDCLSRIYSFTEQVELLRKIPKDSVLFWSPHYNIPLLYRKKLLVTIHDIAHIAFPETAKGLQKQLYSKMMFNAVRRKAGAIIFVSDFSRKEFIRLVGQPRQATYVIYNGIAEEWFSLSKDRNPHKKPYLLFVGNVKPHKNIVRLLKAFELLLNTVPHDLLIVGKKEGFITEDQKALKVAKEFPERVRFLGEVDQGSLKQYYAFADALVFPSLYEGFGLPPLEAMASGCPVVVSAAASLPEVCGDAAYYIDPYNVESIAEGMYKVTTDENLRQDLIQKGLERAKLFSWEKSAREHIKIIEEVLHS